MKYIILFKQIQNRVSHMAKIHFLSSCMLSMYYSYIGLLNEMNLKSVNSNKP